MEGSATRKSRSSFRCLYKVASIRTWSLRAGIRGDGLNKTERFAMQRLGMRKWLQVILALHLCVLCLNAPGDEPRKHQLSSVEEYKQRYGRTVFAESKNGIECFWGCRRDLNPKYPRVSQLHLFDKNSLQVWPLESDQIAKHLAGSDGVHGAALDATGSKVAALPSFFHGSPPAMYSNIKERG